MTEKETNIARMVGVLPSQGAGSIPVGKIPDGATQILAFEDANNSTEIVHTVTAGKTLYLVSWVFHTVGQAPGQANLFIRDDEDAFKGHLAGILIPATAGVCPSVANSVTPPMELLADWDVVLASTVAGLIVWGSIFGYEM